MLNSITNNSLAVTKNYISFDEFEEFYQLPESNPLIIVNSVCEIVYSSESFNKAFGKTASEIFFDLDTEPDLRYLITSLIGSNYNNFQFDLFFPPESSEESNGFKVKAERIFINEQEYFVLIFVSLREKAKLEERINNLHNALEYGNIPVIITDSKGVITYATTSFEKILKKGIEEFFKNSLADVISSYLSAEDNVALNESISEKKNWIKTISIIDRDGNITYYELKLNPVFRGEGEVLNFILTANDITNLKVAYEKEINLNRLKAAFLENMSHEIRTPLNAIVGYSEIIDECIEEGDYETIRELIVSFKDVLGRVLKLYGNIVEVFQIYSGEVELEMVTLNANQVLRSVYNKRTEDAKNKNFNFKLELDDRELNIKIDWFRFEKIINSLVDNAIKYTNSGHVIISSGFAEGYVNIKISDTGMGIKSKDILRLYEPFVQAEEAYTRRYEGAGLGLTIAYKLTLLMGGKFNIESEENRGTNITLTFPVAKDIVENE